MFMHCSLLNIQFYKFYLSKKSPRTYEIYSSEGKNSPLKSDVNKLQLPKPIIWLWENRSNFLSISPEYQICRIIRLPTKVKGGWQLENSSHVVAFVLPLASNVALTLTYTHFLASPRENLGVEIKLPKTQPKCSAKNSRVMMHLRLWRICLSQCLSPLYQAPSVDSSSSSPLTISKSRSSCRTCHCFQQELATDPGIDIDIV